MHHTSARSATSFLQLLWLASPTLPVGGFAYSEGLESFVQATEDVTEIQVSAWLQNQLHVALSRGDLLVLHQAMLAWQTDDFPTLHMLNEWLLQTRESSELRMQTEQMGRSLLEWLRNMPSVDANKVQACSQMTPSYPLAFALAAAHTQASADEAMLAFVFSWAENMAQAAMKSVPLGQSAGQRILASLVDEIPAVVAHAIQQPVNARQAYAPMLAIRSAQHETQYSRLFRS